MHNPSLNNSANIIDTSSYISTITTDPTTTTTTTATTVAPSSTGFDASLAGIQPFSYSYSQQMVKLLKKYIVI